MRQIAIKVAIFNSGAGLALFMAAVDPACFVVGALAAGMWAVLGLEAADAWARRTMADTADGAVGDGD